MNWEVCNQKTALVSETIKTFILPLACPERNSNLLLIELVFKCAKANLFKLLHCKDFNTLLQSVTLFSTCILSELHSSPKNPALYSLGCQLEILDNSGIKVLLGILELLLFKWSLLLSKCCSLILLWCYQ